EDGGIGVQASAWKAQRQAGHDTEGKSQVSRRHATRLTIIRCRRQRLDDIRLANDESAVNGRSSAREEVFARNSVAGNDAVQLVLRGAQMVADQFAEHRAIIVGPLQITAARA